MRRESTQPQSRRAYTLVQLMKQISLSHLGSVLLFVLLVGCNNISQSTLNSAINSTSGNNIGTGDMITNTGGGAFVLTSVLPSQDYPGDLDLIGQNGQFDQFCTGVNNPCLCQYTYTLPNSTTTQTDTQATVYQETNLITCPQDPNLAAGVTTFNLSLITTSQQFASNSISVQLNGTTYAGTTYYLDTSAPSSFVQVSRFQCRHLETVKNFLDGTVLDPIQSENPEIIYPFNYYTTNLSQSLLNIQTGGGAGGSSATQEWDCTLIPNYNHTLQWWANPYVFSLSTCTGQDNFCNGDGELMYPTSSLSSGLIPVNVATNTGRTRASFSLAKQAYGVFTVPVPAAIAPLGAGSPSAGSSGGGSSGGSSGTIYTSATYINSKTCAGGGACGIGYAAKPIPNGTSSTCPSSSAVTIPANAKWVKLWNFKAHNISPPSYVSAVSSFSSGVIACNSYSPAVPACAFAVPTATPFYTSGTYGAGLVCGGGTTHASDFGCQLGGTGADYNDDLKGQTGLATGIDLGEAPTYTRIMSASLGAGAAAVTIPACFNILTSSWNVGNGSEVWQPSPYAYQDAQPQMTVSSMQSFPWNLFGPGLGAPNGTAVDPTEYWTAVPAATPSTPTFTSASFSTDNYTDNLFVVTDPSINDSTFINDAGSYPYYRPVTYRSASDCSASTQEGCLNESPPPTQITWDLDTNAVGDDSTQNVFPLCVLQFYQ